MKYLMIILILVPNLSFATAYVGSGSIRTMQNAYGGWIINTNGSQDNPDNCSKNTVILQSDHGQYQEMLSFLLTAYAANKPVNVAVNGCHSAGYKKLVFVHSAWNN
jgi:hypothetical protein